MSELRDTRNLLDLAERAAVAGDLASAEALLRDAARLQEAELGPLHADLANTLNNLAIVAEQRGRLGEAETFYRRAAAIASASLPPDHPMVTASRANLEDFCRARGLPIEAPASKTLSARDTDLGLDAFAAEDAAGAVETPTNGRPDAGLTTLAPSSFDAQLHDPLAQTPIASQPLPPATPRATRSLVWVAIGVAALVTAALLVGQPWSSRETSTPTPERTAPQAAKPEQPPPAEPPPMPAPVEKAPPQAVVPRADDPPAVADKPSAPAPSSGAITLATAELCETFSTSGGSWRCDPAGDSVPPGPIVLYTRIRSAHDAAVVHHWYRGDTLRQSVTLTIRANAAEGYRTYSRQTVDSGGDWRVEVRSADGDLLHERRFAVR